MTITNLILALLGFGFIMWGFIKLYMRAERDTELEWPVPLSTTFEDMEAAMEETWIDCPECNGEGCIDCCWAGLIHKEDCSEDKSVD